MNNALDFLSKTLDGDVVIACSGGPDSMALLSLLLQFRKLKSINIICAHVNHGVRVESNDEALMVEQFCFKNNIVFELLNINSYDGYNFEAEARNKRYSFFEKVLKKHNCKYLLTAHHGDDLIETVLMKIVRGSSIDGYSGLDFISKRNGYTIVRPLLGVTKVELLNYVESNKIPYAIDKTNDSLDPIRNRFRHVVLPVLKDINPDVHLKFIQYGNLLRSYSEFVNKYVDKTYNTIISQYVHIDLLKKEDNLVIDAVLYRYLLNLYGSDKFDISSKHIELIKKLIFGDKKNGVVYLPNLILKREYNKLMVANDNCDKYNFIFDGELTLPNSMVIKTVDEIDSNSNYVCRLDSSLIKLPIIIRTVKNGDKMILKNSNFTKKVNDIFIDSKISSRESYPIVCDSNDTILWLPGLKKSNLCKTKGESYDIILTYCGEENNE